MIFKATVVILDSHAAFAEGQLKLSQLNFNLIRKSDVRIKSLSL